jgi:tetratricopeptide (TPR) repeat protein
MRSCASGFVGTLVCLFAGFVAPATGCVNTFESDILLHQSQGDKKAVARVIQELEIAYEGEPNLEHTNDLAVARLLTGRYAEAIKLLDDLDRRFPGRAIIAANLGTALELSGNNTEALRWISEGVKRDPKEHFGSEWLHVKILEARIALDKDPEWLRRNTVLGVSFGAGALPVMPASLPRDEKGRQREPHEIGGSIRYQLRERTNFVRPPDLIVADLYAALGDLALASASAGNLEVFVADPGRAYDEALSYGVLNSPLISLRKGRFESAYPGNSWDRQFSSFIMEGPKPRPR